MGCCRTILTDQTKYWQTANEKSALRQSIILTPCFSHLVHLLRIERLRLKAGTALPADELRAEADLALKQQNPLTALDGFYNASVALTDTLDLDPTVPHAGTMKQATLVREDLPIDDMVVTAVRYRPDLEALRTLIAAAEADKGATI